MRSLYLSASILVVASAATADTYALQSAVSGATVYPAGATVMRAITLPEMPAGEHTLQITDVPKGIIADSLRISGGNGLQITAIGFRNDRLPPNDREIAARKAIKERMAAKREEMRAKYDEKARAELEVEAAQARIAFLEAMTDGQAGNAAGGLESGTISVDTLREMLGLVGSETLKALNDAREARNRMKDIDREIDALQRDLHRLQQELDAVALPLTGRVIVSIDVTAAESVSGELGISYQIDEAHWTPVYELFLDTDSARLRMERKAVISQDTGELWNNVAITLSTARPHMQLAPGDLPAERAYLYDPAPVGLARSTMPTAEMMAAPAPLIEMKADMVSATIEMQGLTATYVLPKPVRLEGDNQEGLFSIDTQNLPVKLTAQAVPLLDENVFLFAGFRNDSASPYLPGKASFYRDGAFVGTGSSFDMIAAGQSAELAFGAIDGLTTKRVTLLRESGESGLLSSSNDKVEQYKLLVDNATSRDWNVVLLDRVPFSEEENLEITATAKPAPDEKDVDGKRGVYAWRFTLPAGADRTVTLSYKLKWPENKEMGLEPEY